MSFEGYVQRICRHGHYDEIDVYAWDGKDTCRECGAKFAWSHTVDQTNDEGVPFPVRKISDAVVETCECCGRGGETAPAIYEIPNGDVEAAFLALARGVSPDTVLSSTNRAIPEARKLWAQHCAGKLASKMAEHIDKFVIEASLGLTVDEMKEDLSDVGVDVDRMVDECVRIVADMEAKQ